MLSKKNDRIKAILNQNKEKFIRLVAINKNITHQIALYYEYEVLIYDLQTDSFTNTVPCPTLKSLEFNSGSKLLFLTTKNEIYYVDITSPPSSQISLLQVSLYRGAIISKWFPFNTSDIAYSTTKNEICYQSIYGKNPISNVSLVFERDELDEYVTEIEWYDVDENYKYLLVGLSNSRIFLCDLSEGNANIVNIFERTGGGILKLLWLSYEPGSFISVSKSSGRVIKWNVSKSSYNSIKVISPFPLISMIKFDNNQSILFTNGLGDVVVYDIKHTKIIHSISSSHCQSIFDLKFNKLKPNIFATASYDGTIRLWDMETNKVTDTFFLGTSSNQIELDGDYEKKPHVLCIKWCPTLQNIIASGDSIPMLRIWDITKRKQITFLKFEKNSLTEKQNEINGLDWISQTNDILCGTQCTIYIVRYTHEKSSLNLVRNIVAGHSVYNLIYDEKKDEIFTPCKDGCIRIYKYGLKEQGPTKQLMGHKHLVFGLSLSAKRILASSSDDFRIGLWDIDNINENIFTNQNKFLLGHTDNVRQLVWFDKALTPILVSGSWDSTIRLWEVSKMICVGVISEHQSDVYGLDVSPVHPFLLVSSSRDNTIRFWNYVKAMTISNVVNFDSVGLSDGESELISKAEKVASHYLYEDDLSSFFATLREQSPKIISQKLEKYKKEIEEEEKVYFSKDNIDYSKRKEDVINRLIMKAAKCGEWEKYCDYCMMVNRWEDAVMASPHVSKEYWKYVSGKYAEHCEKENDDENILFASLLSDNMEIAIKTMMSRGEYETAKLVWLTRRKAIPITDKPSSNESENRTTDIVSNEALTTIAKQSANYYLSTGSPLSASISYLQQNDTNSAMKTLIQSSEFEIAYFLMKITNNTLYVDEIFAGLKDKYKSSTLLESTYKSYKNEESVNKDDLNSLSEKLIKNRNMILDELFNNNKINESSLLDLINTAEKIKLIKLDKVDDVFINIVLSMMVLEIFNDNYKSAMIFAKIILCEGKSESLKDNDYILKAFALAEKYFRVAVQKYKSSDVINDYPIYEIHSSLLEKAKKKFESVQINISNLRKVLESVNSERAKRYLCDETMKKFYFVKEETFPHNIVENYQISTFSHKKMKINEKMLKFSVVFIKSEFLEVKKYIHL